MEEVARRGAAALMEELAAADPVSAGRIHINDEYRLLRALEVFRASGRPVCSYARAGVETAAPAHRGGLSGVSPGKLRFLILGLRRGREELYRRIDSRCAAMFRAGLSAEVEGLFEAGYTPLDPGLKAIGYKEFFVDESGSSGAVGRGGPWRLSRDLAGVEALAARNSRHYAKRQITFFASIPGLRWIDVEGLSDPAAAIEKEIETFLKGS
jgi:tRNA dimethylallyltransferase